MYSVLSTTSLANHQLQASFSSVYVHCPPATLTAKVNTTIYLFQTHTLDTIDRFNPTDQLLT